MARGLRAQIQNPKMPKNQKGIDSIHNKKATMAALLHLLLLLTTASAFAPTPPFHHATARPTSSLASSVEQDEISSILRPNYEIEPIALRIGHGFVRFMI